MCQESRVYSLFECSRQDNVRMQAPTAASSSHWAASALAPLALRRSEQ